MPPRTSGLFLLLVVSALAPGRGALQAQEAPPADPPFPFPLYPDRPEEGSNFPGGLSFVVPENGLTSDPAYDPVTRPWAAHLANLLDQANMAAPEVPRPEDGQADWLVIDSPLAAGQSLKQKSDGLFGSVTAEVVYHDPRTLREAPALDSPWKAGQTWHMDLAGPVFLFSELGAAPDPVAPEELKVKYRSGVGCKIPVGRLEVQLQGGRSMTYSDPLGPLDRGGQHTELFFEVKCRCPLPLPGQIGLEYQGSAVPALSPQDRDKINQDLGLAIPVGDAGRFRLGAKHQWENTATTTPAKSSWLDGMQLYLGFELGQGVTKQ
jgi:hypothetical protein